MNEPEKIDPRELSPLALAFVGDSVLEILVKLNLSGGDALLGNTRPHPEHDG